MLVPRSVYELEGCMEGRRLWILAPGPSSFEWTLNREYIEAEIAEPLIALNSAIELCTLDSNRHSWWMFSDKRFMWLYGHEIHGNEKHRRFSTPRQMIVPYHQAYKATRCYAGRRLWEFDYQMKLRNPDTGQPWQEPPIAGKPFWYSPDRMFLPGRCSVLNNAIALAWIMRPSTCVLVGVDFTLVDGAYYNPEIRVNDGPTQREKALSAGLGWFKNSMKHEFFPGLRLVTTSPHLARQAGIEHRSMDTLI
jgi:hypothetical protein